MRAEQRSTKQLGKYHLLERLAMGGMADVYLARISGLGGFERHVVLKTLRAGDVEDPMLVPMFLDEARLVATLHHQHIAQVYEFGREDKTYFLAMEYVHGETIRKVLETANERACVLPLAFGVTVVCAAAAGLHHAHEQRGANGELLGIVHRDVTPSNVLVSYDGSLKLIDFGIAMAAARSTKTRSGYMKGKVGYMAPEQIRGYPVDRRSDVFALGILAYELLTQQPAFICGSQFEALERTVKGDLKKPSEVVPGFPAVLEDIILRALESDPDDRYASAEEMRIALEAAAEQLRLATGETAIVKVLGALFGTRPEPWMAAVPGFDAEDIETLPIRLIDPPPPAETKPAVETKQPRSFARGSGEQAPIADLDPGMTDRLAATYVPPAPASLVVPPPASLLLQPRPATQPRPPTRHGTPPWRAAVVVAVIVGLVAIAGGIAIAIGLADSSAAPVPVPVPVAPKHAPIVPKPAPPKPAPITPIAPSAPAPAPKPPEPAAIEIEPTEITLRVDSDPPGATVVLDGVRLGVAPYTAPVKKKAGQAWLKVRKVGRVPIKIRVSLDRDVTWNPTLPPLRK